jgi:cell wall-associated NlpC family hydrolase
VHAALALTRPLDSVSSGFAGKRSVRGSKIEVAMNALLVIALIGSASFQGVVINPVANMYSKPSEDADVVSQAIYGTNVGFMEEKEGWAKVRTPDDYTGWMPLSSLRRLSAADRLYASTGRFAQVGSLFANLYREPDVTKHQPLLTVPFETRLEALSEPPADGGRWLQVRLPDDRTAWVQRGDIAFDPKPLTIPETIELAKRFLGLTYLWGGTSSFGYDCSGFTQMLVRRRGVTMPRDADLQAAWHGLAAVKRNKLKPGDLLFFGESAEKITHTGMYIGRGKFIHDTTHGRPRVQISRLADQPWTKLLVACRRLK